MLLSVDSLSFTYPKADKKALHSVSLKVAENEYIAILGANGSGKSTLARCIAGLLPASAGTVAIESVPKKVPSALVFQSPGDQIIAETVELDIAFGPENLGLSREEMRLRVSSALGTFALESLSSAATYSLTSGQKQHLALAGAKALNPSVLILDEPTSMLSPLARFSVLAFLDAFHGDGGTILHITHDLSEASRADRVVVLEDGHLVFDGKPEELVDRPFFDLEKWGLSGDDPPPVKKGGPAGGATDGEPVLECSSLGFGPLRSVSLRLLPGTVTAVIGESGSGKSMLLELLAGLRIPASGSIVRKEGQRLSLAVQESEASLFAEFVSDDVAFGPRNGGLSGKALVSRVEGAMNLCGLPFEDFSERRTFSLSGGERRKAALAGIIAMDTQIVLLDEPSSALDTRSRSQLLHLICGLRAEGKTVVFTTNRTEECSIADSVITLPVPASGSFSIPASVSGDKGGKKKYSRELVSLEKLRHGATGSYANLDTCVHRLSPAGKYILAASCIASAVSVQGLFWLSLLIFLECIPVFLSGYTFKRLFFRILKILPWLLLFGLLQYAMAPGILPFFVFLFRFIAMVIPLLLFMFATAHTEIMYGMEDILFPLRLFRIPVRDVALVTGVVFRFITLLYEEAVRISTARINRGAADSRRKGLVNSVSYMASLFVPLVIRTLTRADRLSQAITARYYGTGKSSRYLHWKSSPGRRLAVVSFPVVSLLLIFLSHRFWEYL
jgi:energy-coupling factor transporter ATP-binding protein EcfA2/energy-coupling factor transporter transmembrane protein EcfT